MSANVSLKQCRYQISIYNYCFNAVVDLQSVLQRFTQYLMSFLKLQFKTFIMEEFILENVLAYFNWTRLTKFKCTHILVCYMVAFKKNIYTDFCILY